jgi:SAM-dependent methyltransferase
MDSTPAMKGEPNDHILAIDHGQGIPEGHGAAASGHSVLDDSSVEEHGRTYHSYKQGAYYLPNDGEEQARLDLQHHTVNLLLDGRLALAPITNPKTALDVATGTGIWAVEFAEQHPGCEVVGSDLTLIQPSAAAPPNCSFIKEDAENDEWTYGHRFDYIHMRLVFTCFTDLALVLRKAYDSLEPGGWIEFQDHTPQVLSSDGSSAGSAMEKFGQVVTSGLASIGRDATRISTGVLGDLLTAQGFVPDRDLAAVSQVQGGGQVDGPECGAGARERGQAASHGGHVRRRGAGAGCAGRG